MKIGNKLFFLNKIIVFDKLAYRIFIKLFPKKKNFLKIQNNFIFEYMKNRSNIKKKLSSYLLYLSSPIYKLKKKEYEILQKICLKLKLKLKIRNHPSVNKNRLQVDIIEDLILSKIVVGHNSSALVYSSILNKKTYSIVKKDIFNWNKYGTYNFFKINKFNNFGELLNEVSG